uniref:Uncharacterized protein n=1 Tax=Anguilla anguilla TaxID=7936 RepID=A0A0E9T8Y5_ANGAN
MGFGFTKYPFKPLIKTFYWCRHNALILEVDFNSDISWGYFYLY